MRICILGASVAQLPAINKAIELGIEVLVCDYLENAPGHQLAHYSSYVSTFDIEGVYKAAKEYEVDGIMTMGTDQPVYTAAVVAERLGLPSLLDVDTALAVTNKFVMKKRFLEAKIPTARFAFYGRRGSQEETEELEKLQEPIVIKPLDSQGQRGVFYLENKKQIKDYAAKVLEFSRETFFLVEEYIEHDEITVSGWVQQGKLYILSITDRVTFDEKEHIGICLSHEYPSAYCRKREAEIRALSEKITKSFHIQEGPVYYQLLLNETEIYVNEIACRIGGAFESQFIPVVSGFDPTLEQIHRSLGLSATDLSILLQQNNELIKIPMALSVQFFFMRECLIKEASPTDAILSCEGVLEGRMYVQEGQLVKSVENATSRAGYAIVSAENKAELDRKLINLYERIQIKDKEGENKMIHRRIPFVRKFTRVLSLLFILLMVGTLFSGCKSEEQVRIAKQYGLAYAPLDIMEKMKFYELELAELGLDETQVRWINLANTSAIREAMIADELEIGFVGLPPFLLAVDQGMPWKVMAGLSISDLGLVASKEYEDLESLVGKGKIALPQPGSIQHILLAMAAKREFGDGSVFDQQLVSMKHPDGMASLLSGTEVSAHFTAPPYLYEELENKEYHQIVSGDEAMGEKFSFIAAVCEEDFHKEEKEYLAFIRALARSINFLERNKKASVDLLAPIYGIEAAKLEKYLYEKGMEYTLELYGLETFHEFMYESGYLQKHHRIEDLLW